MKKITLTRNKHALVDNEDFKKVNQFKWNASYNKTTKSFYALGYSPTKDGKRYRISMHRLIMNAKKGQVTDHKNYDTLDNRKSNLRICTNAENIRNARPRKNTSKYKGVYWYKKSKNWRSHIKINGKRITLGSFTDEKNAALAYNIAAKKYFGEFAYLNKVKKSGVS